MNLKKTLLALSASAMIVAPVAAQAGTAASASVGKIANMSGVGMRHSTSVAKKQNVGAGVAVLGVLAIAAGGYGIYEATKKNNDEPASLGS